VGFWVGFWVGLRARDFPTERALSRTPLIIRTVDQKEKTSSTPIVSITPIVAVVATHNTHHTPLHHSKVHPPHTTRGGMAHEGQNGTLRAGWLAGWLATAIPTSYCRCRCLRR
jgi:hypothetical protein